MVAVVAVAEASVEATEVVVVVAVAEGSAVETEADVVVAAAVDVVDPVVDAVAAEAVSALELSRSLSPIPVSPASSSPVARMTFS